MKRGTDNEDDKAGCFWKIRFLCSWLHFKLNACFIEDKTAPESLFYTKLCLSWKMLIIYFGSLDLYPLCWHKCVIWFSSSSTCISVSCISGGENTDCKNLAYLKGFSKISQCKYLHFTRWEKWANSNILKQLIPCSLASQQESENKKLSNTKELSPEDIWKELHRPSRHLNLGVHFLPNS